MADKLTPEQLIQSYEDSIADDYVGLWEVVIDAKHHVGMPSKMTAKERTIDLVRRMLSRGFRPGYLAERGGFKDWPEQNPEIIIRRIETEWDELGRDPTINDICWFNRD